KKGDFERAYFPALTVSCGNGCFRTLFAAPTKNPAENTEHAYPRRIVGTSEQRRNIEPRILADPKCRSRSNQKCVLRIAPRVSDREILIFHFKADLQLFPR